MHSIGEKVIDRNGKVFFVEKMEDKDFGNGLETYLVLKPYFPYDFNPDYHSFIPRNKADELLRPVMTKEEALALIDTFDSLELYPEVSPRERKVFFQKVITSGNRTDICRVVKTLIFYRDERIKNNKVFSDFDKRLLASLVSLLHAEISIALDIPLEQVGQYVTDRTGLTIYH